MAVALRWWSAELVSELIRGLVSREWERLRPGMSLTLLLQQQGNELRFDEEGLAADSLELLQLATAVSGFFQMQHAGLDDYLLARRSLPEWTDIVCQSLLVHDSSIGFRSSGSTGEPTLSVHTLQDLREEVAWWAQLFADRCQIVSAVPRHHIYGFIFSVLLPQALDLPCLDVRGRTPSALGRLVQPGALVIGFPDYWRLVLQSRPALPAGVAGVTSTAPCPPALAMALTPTLLASLSQVYGSSETAGLGWRRQPNAQWRLLPHWQRQHADAVLRCSTQEPYTLQDQLSWQDDRHFELQGRCDHAVQIGGMNVYPEKVARSLESNPEVASAVVRLMSADEGERLKAYVVPHDPAADPDALRSRLERWMEQHLIPLERPRTLTFGKALPVNDLGKLADWPLARTSLRL